LVKWRLVMDTGWTLEYIEGLPASQVAEYFSVLDGMQKGNNSLLRKR
jgi:hypothetical protein